MDGRPGFVSERAEVVHCLLHRVNDIFDTRGSRILGIRAPGGVRSELLNIFEVE